ncbi:hypothetical protein NP233_g3351 [Leucocoprinus birnbaumii]|uniref:Uncharacterized protein n=1 Tax=Leucocoprinus birnbaumii TaxID=56174 RepID=A0AAD5VZA2_9AGAR|nr:hypothetical protein NP233_g3351 [Leucocoprinus birnbaumii]
MLKSLEQLLRCLKADSGLSPPRFNTPDCLTGLLCTQELTIAYDIPFLYPFRPSLFIFGTLWHLLSHLLAFIDAIGPPPLPDCLEVSSGALALILTGLKSLKSPKHFPDVPNKLDAPVLAQYSKEIMKGLISHGVWVTSYACDGSSTEQNSQQILIDMADDHLRYSIKNPNPNGEDLNIGIPVINGQPVVMVQDSKHALKTFRNNAFSGARLLVMGNFIAAFVHMLKIVNAPDSPLYQRDVDQLDLQDDNAATHLFSAKTLELICCTSGKCQTT